MSGEDRNRRELEMLQGCAQFLRREGYCDLAAEVEAEAASLSVSLEEPLELLPRDP